MCYFKLELVEKANLQFGSLNMGRVVRDIHMGGQKDRRHIVYILRVVALFPIYKMCRTQP